MTEYRRRGKKDKGSGTLIIKLSAIVWFKLGFTQKQSHELTDM